MKIVAIIPARYGSTRLPGKPLVDLSGRPMIQHVYERASRATLVDRVIVATDDHRVLEAVQQFGGEAVMTPGDLRSGSDRTAHVARGLTDAGIIVNVQGDEPLMEPAMIDEAVQPLVDDETIPVGTLARRIESAGDVSNPNVVKVAIDTNGFALFFSRSPIPHTRDGAGEGAFKHIGIYAFRRDFLLTFAGLPETPLERAEKLEQLRILEHGYRVKVTLTQSDSIPVDTPEDAERVRRLLGAPDHVTEPLRRKP